MKRFFLLVVLALGPSLASAQRISAVDAHLALEALSNAASVKGRSVQAIETRAGIEKFREAGGRITGVKVTGPDREGGGKVTTVTFEVGVGRSRNQVTVGRLEVRVIENETTTYSAEYIPENHERGVNDPPPGPPRGHYKLSDVLEALNALENVLETKEEPVNRFRKSSIRITKLGVGRKTVRGGMTVTCTLNVGVREEKGVNRGVFTIVSTRVWGRDPGHAAYWEAARVGRDCGLR